MSEQPGKYLIDNAQPQDQNNALRTPVAIEIKQLGKMLHRHQVQEAIAGQVYQKVRGKDWELLPHLPDQQHCRQCNLKSDASKPNRRC
jgi:hypothetical protein